MKTIKGTKKKKTKQFSEEKFGRKTKEKVFGESEEKLKSIFENTNDGIIFLDKFGKILDVNKKTAEIFGRPKKELIGKHFTKTGLFPIKEMSTFIRNFENILTNKKTYYEVSLKNKKGQQIVLECSISFIKIDEVVRIMIIVRDITERKKVEEALQKNLLLYQGLVEATNTGFVILDQEGRIIKANQEYVHISGHEDFNQIRGRSVVEWTADYEKEKNIEAVDKCFREGKIRGLEIDYVNAQGKITPVEIYATVMKVNGESQIITLCRDITEHRKVEEALREEKNKLQKYLDVAGIIVLILSSEGKVLLINNKGYEILGCKGREILGKDWFTNFIPEKNRTEARTVFEKLINKVEDHVEYFENLVLTKNGEKKTISWHNSLLKDEKGRVQAILSTGADITELKKAKMTIEQLRELDKMKDEFLNIAAHELRTPLTSIIGLSEIIREQKPSLASSSKKYIDIINAEGIKLSRIIKRMLTVTRFESGRETVYLEQFNLPAFVLSFLSNLNIIAKEKKSRIVFKTEKKSIVIRSDKEKISQVIYNFIDNAVKYGPETQTIILAVTKPEKRWIKIAVTDQGPGIPPELQKKLFAKFSQLEPSLTRSQGGTGLGLYICKLIVDMLGGKIGVKSKLGKGSTFYFIFPIRKISKKPLCKNETDSFLKNSE